MQIYLSYSWSTFLNRFLKDNHIDVSKYIINEPLTKNKSLNLKGNEDFISYPSCSYISKL